MLFNVIYTIGNNENQDLIIIDAPEDFPLIGRECPELKTYIRACHHDLPMIDEIDILRILEVYRHRPNIAPTAPAAISTSSLPGVRMIRYWKSGIWMDDFQGPRADSGRVLSVPAGADDVYIQKTVQNAITEWKEEGIINKISSTPSRAAGEKMIPHAECTWGDGPDVAVQNEDLSICLDLTIAEARGLAAELMLAADTAESLEKQANTDPHEAKTIKFVDNVD